MRVTADRLYFHACYSGPTETAWKSGRPTVTAWKSGISLTIYNAFFDHISFVFHACYSGPIVTAWKSGRSLTIYNAFYDHISFDPGTQRVLKWLLHNESFFEMVSFTS